MKNVYPEEIVGRSASPRPGQKSVLYCDGISVNECLRLAHVAAARPTFSGASSASHGGSRPCFMCQSLVKPVRWSQVSPALSLIFAPGDGLPSPATLERMWSASGAPSC